MEAVFVAIVAVVALSGFGAISCAQTENVQTARLRAIATVCAMFVCSMQPLRYTKWLWGKRTLKREFAPPEGRYVRQKLLEGGWERGRNKAFSLCASNYF